MAQSQDKNLRIVEQSSNSKSNKGPGRSSHSPVRKPAMDWEQPDCEELDLCMEVTTYIHHWQ